MPDVIPINQIVTPTSKWQITIPKKLREKLNMEKKTPLNATVKDGSLIMVPIKKMVKEDIWTEERRKELLKALKEARGIWAKDWPKIKKRLEKQRKIELEAAKKARKAW